MTVEDEFIDRFLDDEVSDDEKEQLMQWLNIPGNLDRFARRSELHADLRSALRRRSIQSSALESVESVAFGHATNANAPDAQDTVIAGDTPASVWSGYKTTLLGMAIAATLLLAWASQPKGDIQDGSSEKVAKIIARIDALLTKDESQWDADELIAGGYELQSGLLHLQFDGGVMVYVEAPAGFQVSSGKRMSITRGRLSASVPPAGIGFAIDTPEAEVIDFGTEFSVDVESGSSEVHVFDGLVRVQPKPTIDGEKQSSIDLRTSQAVKIDDSDNKLVDIQIAHDRFIRDFDEPKQKYFRSLRKLSPLAVYRMAIRDQGLQAIPPQYSGKVLTGPGLRPPHARGVFAGGALRMGGKSSGRGGKVIEPPPLKTGQLSLAVFVYLDEKGEPGSIATNMASTEGTFSLAINEDGKPRAIVRDRMGNQVSVVSEGRLPFSTWRYLVVTVDDDELRLYEDGELIAAASCDGVATSLHENLWFGTNADGSSIWNGRIDELAIFDIALSDQEIAEVYRSALEEMTRVEHDRLSQP
ncbi:MAG: LamG-like jellyroll fold domain-containing protein [Planctomycetota bacterium]